MPRPHLFELRRTMFVLWRPLHTAPVPRLVIGWFQHGNEPELSHRQDLDLAELPGCPGLWGIPAAACGLTEGNVYHYWFEVNDSAPGRVGHRVLCTDPFAHTVDWRLRGPLTGGPYTDNDRNAAAVVRYEGGELVSCSAAGETVPQVRLLPTDDAPKNNHMVIYELPVSWTRKTDAGGIGVGVGTFRDVAALVDPNAEGANFAGVPALAAGRSHLVDLGINALELLPPTDSSAKREWGYAPSNYCAPDFDMGFPEGHSFPTANTDLAALVTLLHGRGIRFLIDAVMAFGTRAPMESVNFAEFHIDPGQEPGNSESWQSSRDHELRDGYGGRPWRYAQQFDGYDPMDGVTREHYPARQFMSLFLLRWMEDFAIDGVRLDSVNNIANWRFVGEFRDLARAHWAGGGGAPDRFLVVGEELSMPLDLLSGGHLDGLWNEPFKERARGALLGESHAGASFADTVRDMIDCTRVGFTDGAQAVNYLGSHDVKGMRNERLFNFLRNNGVDLTQERIQLAFVCLLTAVGVPMILAGDEFADRHDMGAGDDTKQLDAVNFERADEDPWRKTLFEYVARLVKFRTEYAALGLNDTTFLHEDFSHGKRVVAWRRGRAGDDEQVVVVANFSDFGTDPGGEYVTPNWPATPPGRRWREITQGRDVPLDWVHREGLQPWEAKVYALVA